MWLNRDIYNLLNEAVENGIVEDSSLFCNEVDYNPMEKKFETFISTDLWSFNGTLVVTTLNFVPLANKVVNKIKLIYLYTRSEMEKGNIGHLMEMINLSKNTTIMASNEEDKKEFYRLTKVKIPVISKFTAEEILKVKHE